MRLAVSDPSGCFVAAKMMICAPGLMSMSKAGANAPGAELGRIPVGTGPWGIAVSPDGAWVATANRESARVRRAPNRIDEVRPQHERFLAEDMAAALNCRERQLAVRRGRR